MSTDWKPIDGRAYLAEKIAQRIEGRDPTEGMGCDIMFPGLSVPSRDAHAGTEAELQRQQVDPLASEDERTQACRLSRLYYGYEIRLQPGWSVKP